MKPNEKACPRCAEHIKSEASVCKHCGYAFSPEELAQARAAKQAQQRNGMFGCLGCGGLIAVALAIAVLADGGGSTSTSADGQTAFVSLYKEVIAVATPCDRSFEKLKVAGESGEIVAVYGAAKDGFEMCRDAAMTLADKTAPAGMSSEANTKTQDALRTCTDAYLARQAGFESAMKYFDGEQRPSVQASMNDNLERGKKGVLLCVAGFFDAAAAAGVDTNLLK